MFNLTVGTLLTNATAHASTLAERINALLGDAQVQNAQVGIEIDEISPAGPRTLYTHRADLPLMPASNTKLLTTAAAFEKYGPNGVLTTDLYESNGNLILVGGGDPAFCDGKLAQEAGWAGGPAAVLDQWVEHLKKTGTTTAGDVIVDDTAFDAQFVHPHWPVDQLLTWYEAPVGALNLNDNCLDWLPTVSARGVGVTLIPANSYTSVDIQARRGGEQRVWLWRPTDSNHFEMRGTVHRTPDEPESVSIVDPGLWAGTVLRDRLAAGGVRVTGTVHRGALPAGAKLVARNETPLPLVLRRANKNSVNMMAEALCKKLGHDASGSPGTWRNGTAAVKDYLHGLGLADGLATLDDGSGLSREDRVAAHVFATVLAHVASRPDGHIFIDSMAIPGEDGTLKGRFEHSAVAKFVHAKTGHIKGASTLSGYLVLPGRTVVFSILCNKYQGNVNPWQEKVCEAVGE